jgi:hypothetical protein
MKHQAIIDKGLIAPPKPGRTTTELQNYVDNAPISLHWIDAGGFIKWANNAELNLRGYN